MKKILIIDDNEDILDIFNQLLVNEGYTVSAANNGLTGLKLFTKECFDLVITDINMPGIDGLELVKRINHIITVPIILMSSDYQLIDPDEIRRLGVNAIISKTISDYEFCELTRNCLENRVFESKIF